MNHQDHETLEKWKQFNPKWFKDVSVLEIGSCNINGTVRDHFETKKYIGVDWHEGTDVDIVVHGHLTKFKKDQFDVIISFSALEHDCHYPETLTHNLPYLKKGGIIMLSWAGPGTSSHSLEHATDNDEFKPVPSASEAYQKLKKEGHYYPKSLEEVSEPLEKAGCKILDTYYTFMPSLNGPVCRLTAKKL